MKIRAAFLQETGEPFEIADLELEEPHAGEVLVRLAATGVCASDAHTRSGRIPSPTPCVLGHEGAGVVEKIGEGVTNVKVGDHVALSWMPNCGECRHCHAGRPVLCTAAAPYMLAGTMLDGTTRLSRGGENVFQYSFISTFASHTVVPAASAIKIDDSVPFSVASIVGCAIMTGFGAAVNRAGVRPGTSIVIFGAGGVGLSAVMGAQISGAKVIIVVDPIESKRKEALAFGATIALAPSDDLVEQIKMLTNGFGVDYAIDAVGHEAIARQAFDATVSGGTIVTVGMPAVEATYNFPGTRVVREEKVITGSLYGSCRPAIDIPMILDLYQQGKLPLDRMVTETYELDEINEAFEDLQAGRLNRGVIILDEGLCKAKSIDSVENK